MQSVSFIIPTHNNLRYIKHAYRSIRTHAGNARHEIVILDDNSTDGTVEWLRELESEDFNVKTFYNTGDKVGHTVLYNVGVDIMSNEIFSILHADMYIAPNYVENILKHLKPGKVVAATRIEPPLHPSGPEKITKDFGMWPEDFRESEFLKFVEEQQVENSGKTTKGIFAPWAMYKSDYTTIGGHDELFAPYPYEDSDIFQRMILEGYEIIQSRDALVYHLTCRGHKWTDGEKLGKVDDDYAKFELNARRNYIRKWGMWIENDEYSYPIIYPKYSIALEATNMKEEFLYHLEPHFSDLIMDLPESALEEYVKFESQHTPLNLSNKLSTFEQAEGTGTFPITVKVDFSKITEQDSRMLFMIPRLLMNLEREMNDEFGVQGTFEVGNIEIVIEDTQLVNMLLFKAAMKPQPQKKWIIK